MADSVIHTKYDPTAPALPPQGQLDNFPVLRECAASYLSPAEVEKIERAYEFARAHHRDQKRKSGEPYINHPVEVAIILAKNLHSDVDMLCAGLLHDTVEDTDATLDELSELFGPQVSELVDGVTKLTNISVSSLSEQQALNLRKMFLAMAKDIRVIIIKLADRLHNMRTLMAIPEDRRIFKANETMSIYAPLANRLGISSIKWELEDLSFFYLDPAKYRQVARMVAESRAEREAYLETVKTILRDELTKAKIEHFRIMGRPKHLYSIYMKMKNKGKDFSEIYDLIALRVITDDVRECYGVLGAVHALWTPMPGRFKDYIAMPKFNMYQSLHTTVIGPAGRPLEVQIRTEEMNEHAEYGIAAHWLYKQAGNSDGDKQSSAQRLDDQLAWLGRTLDWTQQDDLSDPQEFLEAVKIDLYDSEVFVFTPAGEVQVLRAGSTPIDFAYAVHTEVGHHCIGAKVNGTVVPLSYELQMGDRVEIITQNNAKPSRDWLNIVKTPGARQKIRSYFSRMTKADDSAAGRDQLARELLKVGLGIDDVLLKVNSGDPPLFEQSSLPLIKAVEHAGVRETDAPATCVTVKEPVAFGGGRGDFLLFLPAADGERNLRIDCGISWNTVIGDQRVLFDVTPETFRYAALARTNATRRQYLLAKTVGKLFASTRNWGYNERNILIHGHRRFYTEPRFPVGEKFLEPVWHRATLDLMAALARTGEDRFVGTVVSFRAGHTLDCDAVRALYRNDLLTEV